jgi:hypothetical protein
MNALPGTNKILRKYKEIKAASGALARYVKGRVNYLWNKFERYRFMRSTRSSPIYYSIAVPTHIGFTDQILLFGLLYKLSSLLGLKYHYTPIEPRRNILKSGMNGTMILEGQESNDYQGIFDFLGFDWFFSEDSAGQSIDEVDTIEFHFCQSYFDKHHIGDLDDLIKRVMKLILESLPPQVEPLHIRFVIKVQIRPLVWLHKLPNTLLDFDLSDIYTKFRAQAPFPDTFESAKPKILIHSRQGDTAVISTPWNTFIQIWARGRDAFVERQSIEDIEDHQVITVSDFERFYADLKSALDEYQLSTQLHSDGFVRSFFALNEGIDRLSFTQEQKEMLKIHAESYDECAFGDFQKHSEVTVLVGEKQRYLFDLMHAFYSADIVIVGTQQRMLAKQYAYSFSDGGGPLFITLYKKEFPHYSYLGNSNMMRNCLYVNLDEYNISDVMATAHRHLAERYQQEIR